MSVGEEATIKFENDISVLIDNDGPPYKPETWEKDKTHFDYIDLFEKMQSARDAREDLAALLETQVEGEHRLDEEYLTALKIAEGVALTKEEEAAILRQAKLMREQGLTPRGIVGSDEDDYGMTKEERQLAELEELALL